MHMRKTKFANRLDVRTVPQEQMRDIRDQPMPPRQERDRIVIKPHDDRRGGLQGMQEIGKNTNHIHRENEVRLLEDQQIRQLAQGHLFHPGQVRHDHLMSGSLEGFSHVLQGVRNNPTLPLEG
jgi:hypothetical protein